MSKITSLVRTHPITALVVAGLAGVVVAFAWGRFFAPLKSVAAKLPGSQPTA